MRQLIFTRYPYRSPRQRRYVTLFLVLSFFLPAFLTRSTSFFFFFFFHQTQRLVFQSTPVHNRPNQPATNIPSVSSLSLSLRAHCEVIFLHSSCHLLYLFLDLTCSAIHRLQSLERCLSSHLYDNDAIHVWTCRCPWLLHMMMTLQWNGESTWFKVTTSRMTSVDSLTWCIDMQSQVYPLRLHCRFILMSLVSRSSSHLSMRSHGAGRSILQHPCHLLHMFLLISFFLSFLQSLDLVTTTHYVISRLWFTESVSFTCFHLAGAS